MISTPSSRSGRSRSPRCSRRCGSRVGHRDLKHRDGRAGIHDGQRHIRAVIEPAVRVVGDGLVVGHQRLDARGEACAPWRVVGGVVVVTLREAPEVMRQWRIGDGRPDRQRGGLPMSGHDERSPDGVGSSRRPCRKLRRPTPRRRRSGWRAMGQVQGRDHTPSLAPRTIGCSP